METMHKLITIRLNNEAHYDFMVRFLKQEIDSAPAAVKTALAAALPTYNAAITHEIAWEDWTRHSDLTREIVAADRERDRTISAIKQQIRASSYSIHPDIAAAAQRLQALFKEYGNVQKKSYEAENTAISSILRHLKTDANADALKAGLKSWITILESNYEKFIDLFDRRIVERAERPTGTYRSARAEMDAIYRRIVAILEVGTDGPNAAAFITFINQLNIEIDRLNANFAPPAKFDMAACVPDRIPDQVETGDPLTPCIPAVYYPFDEERLDVRIEEHSVDKSETDRTKIDEKGIITRMERLVLGKDYSLSYRNNIKPGTGIAIIRGRGRFKGKYEEAFLILPYGYIPIGDEANCSCGCCSSCLAKPKADLTEI